LGDYTYSLSLWLEHPDADLSTVPIKLGLSARHLWKKGDVIRTPRGRTIDGVRKKSYCSVQFDIHDLPELSAGLKAALALLLPHREYFEKLSADGVQARFFVGWFSKELNSREILASEILKDLASLNISLDLDLYGSEANRNSQAVEAI